jgi:hypothetical protein
METITAGGMNVTRIAETPDGPISVRAPRMHVRWRTVDAAPPPLSEALPAEGGNGGWQEAIDENELRPFGPPIEAQPFAIELADMPALEMPGSSDEFVEMRATPPPGEGLLLMVESEGIIQWILPSNPQQDALLIAEGLSENVAVPAELRFHIPQSTLLGTSIAGSSEGFFGAIGRAVVRFFSFTKELVGAALETVLQFIVDRVEARNKQEAFRFFDRATNFAEVPPAALAQMAGQRVLLLTHGIFSSLAGAFDGISDPNGAVLQHLRTIYQDRIIGWDHWTIAKTPLENARDLLERLPAGIEPDIVCHSRGGLVTRAMLEHETLRELRASRFPRVGKAVFVAAANQGSQLARLANLNRLLNIYSAVASIPILGAAGVVLKVVVGVLKVLAQVATRLPSIEALSSDLSRNTFLEELNGPLLTPIGEIVVVHANYDPAGGPLGRFLDLNVDTVFNAANDMVVPFAGARLFDKFQQVGTNINFGSAVQTQSVVMHLNFFRQPGVHDLLRAELV